MMKIRMKLRIFFFFLRLRLLRLDDDDDTEDEEVELFFVLFLSFLPFFIFFLFAADFSRKAIKSLPGTISNPSGNLIVCCCVEIGGDGSCAVVDAVTPSVFCLCFFFGGCVAMDS